MPVLRSRGSHRGCPGLLGTAGTTIRGVPCGQGRVGQGWTPLLSAGTHRADRGSGSVLAAAGASRVPGLGRRH